MLRLDEGAQLVVDHVEDPSHARSIPRRLAALAAGFLLVAACGGGGGGGGRLDEVADRLSHLERARVSLEVDTGAGGFTIEGAFAIDGDHPLPVAELTYTPRGEDVTPTTVLLTGDDGFVEVEGVAYRLPPAQLDALRVPDEGAANAVSSIRLREWFRQPEDDLKGPGDPRVVVEDILGLATGLGAPAVRSQELRSVGAVEVGATADDDGDLEELTATGTGLRFTLRLSHHGDAVEVAAPKEARPYEELGR